MKKAKPDIEPVATNRKAFYNYTILETFEAGLALAGPEVKSLRNGGASLEGSFVRPDGNQLFVYGLHIAPYSFNHTTALETKRPRKLLLHSKEIKKLSGQNTIKGNAIVPLELYFRKGWAKLKIGLAKGKKAGDKRDSIRKKDLSREMERDFRNNIKI